MRDCIQRPCGLTQLRPLLHHWSHGRCPWCWRILLLSRRFSARGSGHPRTSAVSQALIVLNNVERGQIFNYSPKKKVALLFPEEDDGWKDARSAPAAVTQRCVCPRRQHPSHLSLSLLLCFLSVPPSPSLPHPLPPRWLQAELISADVTVTEAGCESRNPPRVAAQQGHQFSWLNFLIWARPSSIGMWNIYCCSSSTFSSDSVIYAPRCMLKSHFIQNGGALLCCELNL